MPGFTGNQGGEPLLKDIVVVDPTSDQIPYVDLSPCEVQTNEKLLGRAQFTKRYGFLILWRPSNSNLQSVNLQFEIVFSDSMIVLIAFSKPIRLAPKAEMLRCIEC